VGRPGFGIKTRRTACLTIEVERLQARLARAHGQERDAQLQEALRRLPGRLKEGTLRQRRALVAGLVSRVRIDDDGRVSVGLRRTDLCPWAYDALEPS